MAAITFRARIAQDLRLELPAQTMIDQTNAREEPANPATETEDTTRTGNVAKRIAARVERYLGTVGAFDDTDDSVGDLIALDFGVQWARLELRVNAAGGHSAETLEEEKSIKADLKAEAHTRVMEISTPAVHDREVN